jgi:hypothetical protein
MPELIASTAVIQAFFIVHVFRTARPYWWALLIVATPVVGCVIYYLLEIFPGSSEQRSARRAAVKVASALMVNGSLRRRLMDAESCPSVANKVAAAEELVRCGMYYRAVGMFQSALQGIYVNDPQLMLGLARAHVNNETFEQAREVLARLQRIDRRYCPEEACLLNARALEGLGDHEDALLEYERLTQVFVGLEARCRYGLLLKRLGLNVQANRVFEEVLAHARRFNVRVHTEQVWIDMAKRSLVHAQA